MISYGIFAMSSGAGYLVQEKRLADGRTVDRFRLAFPRARSSSTPWRIGR